MDRILIVGASNLQLPAILKAKELGYYVGVADYDNNAEGVLFADEFFNVSTIDIEGITSVAQKFDPVGIITLATDAPIRAVAKACEVCGLSGIGYETAVMATNKGKMIEAFEKGGVDHPWYYVVNSEDNIDEVLSRVSFPCIIKPTDNAGSRGVVLCKNIKEIKELFHYSLNESRAGEVIIEEYLQGPEVSVEVMVIDGEPIVIQTTDKLTTGPPFFVEMGHSQPSSLPDSQQRLIKSLACNAVKSLGICCGPSHVEIIATNTGPKIVELGARLGGDYISTHLVPLSTGIDFVKGAIDVACGKIPDIDAKYCKGAAIRYFDAAKGKLKSVKGIEKAMKISGIKKISIDKEIGDELEELKNSKSRLGYVIAQAKSPEIAVNKCMTAMQDVIIEIEQYN